MGSYGPFLAVTADLTQKHHKMWFWLLIIDWAFFSQSWGRVDERSNFGVFQCCKLRGGETDRFNYNVIFTFDLNRWLYKLSFIWLSQTIRSDLISDHLTSRIMLSPLCHRNSALFETNCTSAAVLSKEVGQVHPFLLSWGTQVREVKPLKVTTCQEKQSINGFGNVNIDLYIFIQQSLISDVGHLIFNFPFSFILFQAYTLWVAEEIDVSTILIVAAISVAALGFFFLVGLVWCLKRRRYRHRVREGVEYMEILPDVDDWGVTFKVMAHA